MRLTELMAHWGRMDMFTEFRRINLKNRDNSKNLNIDERIILKCILE